MLFNKILKRSFKADALRKNRNIFFFSFRDPSVTPVFKEEMLKNIHCLTQCIIIFLHKLKPQYLSDFFLESCLKFLDKDDLPLNTKTNLSIIIGMVNQMSDTYKWNEVKIIFIYLFVAL